MGQKVQSRRLSHGHHDRLEEPLVCLEEGVRQLLFEDKKIRKFIKNHPSKQQYRQAGIDRIEIERTRDEVKVVLFVARPG
jgi:small subunit ribosomal protein S3